MPVSYLIGDTITLRSTNGIGLPVIGSFLPHFVPGTVIPLLLCMSAIPLAFSAFINTCAGKYAEQLCLISKVPGTWYDDDKCYFWHHSALLILGLNDFLNVCNEH